MDRNIDSTVAGGTDRRPDRADDAARNRDALADENRRVAETSPAAVPPQASAGAAREAVGENVEHVQEAAENRRALAEQARRTEASLPPDVPMRDRRAPR